MVPVGVVELRFLHVCLCRLLLRSIEWILHRQPVYRKNMLKRCMQCMYVYNNDMYVCMYVFISSVRGLHGYDSENFVRAAKVVRDDQHLRQRRLQRKLGHFPSQSSEQAFLIESALRKQCLANEAMKVSIECK